MTRLLLNSDHLLLRFAGGGRCSPGGSVGISAMATRNAQTCAQPEAGRLAAPAPERRARLGASLPFREAMVP
jgi:hypothetical protein